MKITISMTPEEAVAHVQGVAQKMSGPLDLAQMEAVETVLRDLMADSRANNLRAAMLEQSPLPRHEKSRCGTNNCPRCSYDVYEADLGPTALPSQRENLDR